MSAINRTATRSGVILLVLCVVSGCVSSLLPTPAAPPTLFALDDEPRRTPAPPSPASRSLGSSRTLLVGTPHAAAGFDSAQMVYRRQPNEFEVFARNRWVDTPSRMLAPLLMRAIERTGAFRTVIDATTSAKADLRLDSEIVRLQQDLTTSPSRVELTLRVVLVDIATRRVVAAREFDASQPTAGDDPRSGVAAANEVVGRVLVDVAAFCIEFGSIPGS